MTVTQDGTATGGASPPVRTWDPLLRVFHWTLVALVVIALATGDEVESVHIAVGYGIAILLGSPTSGMSPISGRGAISATTPQAVR